MNRPWHCFGEATHVIKWQDVCKVTQWAPTTSPKHRPGLQACCCCKYSSKALGPPQPKARGWTARLTPTAWGEDGWPALPLHRASVSEKSRVQGIVDQVTHTLPSLSPHHQLKLPPKSPATTALVSRCPDGRGRELVHAWLLLSFGVSEPGWHPAGTWLAPGHRVPHPPPPLGSPASMF